MLPPISRKGLKRELDVRQDRREIRERADRLEGRFAAKATGVLEAIGGRLAEHGDGGIFETGGGGASEAVA